jgi:hypothetical protein
MSNIGTLSVAEGVAEARPEPSDSTGLIKATVVAVNWTTRTIDCDLGANPNNRFFNVPVECSCAPVVGSPVWLARMSDTYIAITAPIDPWHAPTFTGAWANFGAAYAKAGYRLEAPDIVRIVGVVKSGTGNIFTLPVGYRPTGSFMFATNGNDAYAAIEVVTSGILNLRAGSASSWLSITCTFSLSAPQ